MPAASLRIVLSPIFIPLDAFLEPNSSSHANSKPDPVKVWAALASQRSQVLYRRAEGLTLLMSQLRADCLETWPSYKPLRGIALWLKLRTRFQGQSKPIPTVLLLESNEVLQGTLPCLPHWGSEDIEAECSLDAAATLQLPVAELAIEFEVHLTEQGNWIAHYMACPQSLIKLYLAQINVLDLHLKAITCVSENGALCESWGLTPELIAQALRPPLKGELASQYFNSFKGHKPC